MESQPVTVDDLTAKDRRVLAAMAVLGQLSPAGQRLLGILVRARDPDVLEVLERAAERPKA